MSDIVSIVDKIEDRVVEILVQKEQLEAELVLCRQENEKLKASLAALSEDKNKTEQDQQKSKLTKAIEQREDIDEFRSKIDELLQKVNKALALLVSVEDKKEDHGRGDCQHEC